MGLIRINNRNNFILGEIPNLHPDSRAYISYWKNEKKKIIEGFWGVDDKDIIIESVEKFNVNVHKQCTKWRFMPPSLYFYINFGTILHRPKHLPKTSPKLKIRPTLRDIDWEIYYDVLEARGFSGFEGDEEYTSCVDIINPDIELEDYDDTCFNKKGKLKEYIPAYKYLRKLHPKQLGLPIYRNGAQNYMILATRELGKSYSIAGVIVHELLMDGLKTYELGQKIPVSKQFVGSGISGKSHDLMKKIKIMVENLPGTWKPGTEDTIPSPLFKQMKGSIKPNNKWIHEYLKRSGAGWETVGSLSEITHGVWTTENPEAAAGERYTFVVCEEVGLTPGIFTIHGSNSAAQMQGTIQMGTAIYIGTGGNVEKILESEMLFTDPSTYNMLQFEDTYEGSGKIGRFFSVIYKDEEFKDENGNTNETKATEFYLKKRKRLEESNNRRALDMEMLNYPMKPSEMFLNKTSNKFPIADIKIRIRDLISNNNEELKRTYIGFYGINQDGTVKFEEDKSARPIHEFPLNKDNASLIGAVEMFEPPVKNNAGNVPAGIYASSLDPVDDDGNEKASQSLQSFYIINLLTDRIVLEYTARTKFAKHYYEQVRRILIDYNTSVLYENQKKGFYTYFDQKNCLYLLEDTPQALKDSEAQRGSFMGNKSKGIYATDKLNYWGQQELLPNYLESQAYGAEDGVTNLQVLKSLGALKEMVYYNGKINTDRISSLGLLMIIRELKLKHKVQIKQRVRKITNDPFFKRHTQESSRPTWDFAS